MLILAMTLFIIAAIFGLIILTSILKGKPTPKLAVFLHGPLAATALIIALVYMVLTGSSPLLITSLILFVIAALGGLTLFTMDMTQGSVPKLLAVLHPLIAVSGLVVLILYFLQYK